MVIQKKKNEGNFFQALATLTRSNSRAELLIGCVTPGTFFTDKIWSRVSTPCWSGWKKKRRSAKKLGHKVNRRHYARMYMIYTYRGIDKLQIREYNVPASSFWNARLRAAVRETSFPIVKKSLYNKWCTLTKNKLQKGVNCSGGEGRGLKFACGVCSGQISFDWTLTEIFMNFIGSPRFINFSYNRDESRTKPY